MVLKIRLARFGKRHAPFYNIVVAHARTARNSKPLEVLGTYDPIPKTPTVTNNNGPSTSSSLTGLASSAGIPGAGAEVEMAPRRFKDIRLDVARAKYWLGVGAQPSDPAWRLLSMIGLLEPKYRVGQMMNKKNSEPEE